MKLFFVSAQNWKLERSGNYLSFSFDFNCLNRKTLLWSHMHHPQQHFICFYKKKRFCKSCWDSDPLMEQRVCEYQVVLLWSCSSSQGNTGESSIHFNLIHLLLPTATIICKNNMTVSQNLKARHQQINRQIVIHTKDKTTQMIVNLTKFYLDHPSPLISNNFFNKYLLLFFSFFVDFGLLHYSCGVVFIVASITSSLQMAALFGSSNVFDRCWCSYIGWCFSRKIRGFQYVFTLFQLYYKCNFISALKSYFEKSKVETCNTLTKKDKHSQKATGVSQDSASYHIINFAHFFWCFFLK